jgi:integrase/recombinase XerD
MTDKAISPLRRRLIKDMAIRRLGLKTQHHYIRHVKSSRTALIPAPGDHIASSLIVRRFP